MEYDFVPNNVAVKPGEYIHLQWSGSDYNVPRNPNNGIGWKYSDRSNLVQLAENSGNIPEAASKQTWVEDPEMARNIALQGLQVSRTPKCTEAQAATNYFECAETRPRPRPRTATERPSNAGTMHRGAWSRLAVSPLRMGTTTSRTTSTTVES